MMREMNHVKSIYLKKTFAINGHVNHLKPGQKPKLIWFIYLMKDLGCQKQYVGSTINICRRRTATKSAFNKKTQIPLASTDTSRRAVAVGRVNFLKNLIQTKR